MQPSSTYSLGITVILGESLGSDRDVCLRPTLLHYRLHFAVKFVRITLLALAGLCYYREARMQCNYHTSGLTLIVVNIIR